VRNNFFWIIKKVPNFKLNGFDCFINYNIPLSIEYNQSMTFINSSLYIYGLSSFNKICFNNGNWKHDAHRHISFNWVNFICQIKLFLFIFIKLIKKINFMEWNQIPWL
jgi:hypothetical protein